MLVPKPGRPDGSVSFKPKKRKKSIERVLAKKESKVWENVKTAMFIKGPHTSQIVNDVMNDFASLKRPHSIKYNKKTSNGKGPFEDESSVEFFSSRSDASLFVYGNHSKKRPNNIVIGRLFHYHILDMIEFGILKYKGIKMFPSKFQNVAGSKPCFAIIGSEFQTEECYKKAANLIIDFFKGRIVDVVNLTGLDHVIVLSVGGEPDSILFRRYSIQMKKSGTRVPKVDLEEIGPTLDWTFRRTHFAAPDLEKEALILPPQLKQKKKEKNISTNAFHDRMGTVHVNAQTVEKIIPTLVPPKALRTKGKRHRGELSWEDETATQDSKRFRLSSNTINR